MRTLTFRLNDTIGKHVRRQPLEKMMSDEIGGRSSSVPLLE